jgi:hypothetical protein
LLVSRGVRIFNLMHYYCIHSFNYDYRIAAQKAKSLWKYKAAGSPHAPPSVILKDFKMNVGTEVHPTLPSDDVIKRNIRRWRAIPGMKNPKTRDEIVFSEEQKKMQMEIGFFSETQGDPTEY